MVKVIINKCPYYLTKFGHLYKDCGDRLIQVRRNIALYLINSPTYMVVGYVA